MTGHSTTSTACETCGRGRHCGIYSVREYPLFTTSTWLCYTCAFAAGWVKASSSDTQKATTGSTFDVSAYMPEGLDWALISDD